MFISVSCSKTTKRVHMWRIRMSFARLAFHTKTLKQWKYDSISVLTGHKQCDVWHHRFRKPPFSSVHAKTRSWRFWWPKTPFKGRRMAKTERKKISVFTKIWIRVDGVGTQLLSNRSLTEGITTNSNAGSWKSQTNIEPETCFSSSVSSGYKEENVK